MPSIYGLGGICAVFTLKLFPYVYLYVSGAMGSIVTIRLFPRAWL